MRKFVINVLLFFIIILLGYLVISFFVNQIRLERNDYMAAIADKHSRIEEINGPKLILAGGSNLAFGIDSKNIQDEFGVPVANLGLHAGLGLEFIINELKASIKKGDVVILSIEYFLDQGGSYDLKNHTTNLYPKASNFYKKNIREDIVIDIGKTRKSLKSINRRNTDTDLFSVYSRKGFNEFGDVISHLNKTPPKTLKNRGVFSYRFWEGIKILNNFYGYAKSKGVNTFFVFPNYPKSEYVKNNLVINKLHQDLLENILIEILGTPQKFVFKDSLFYDTIYHLNKEGRALRTSMLIEELKKSTNAQQSIKKIAKQTSKEGEVMK